MSSNERPHGNEIAARRAVLHGDDAAWEALCLEHWRPLARFVREALRAAGAEDLTDEVLQDGWMQGVKNIRRFDPTKGNFLGWMKGVMRNVLRDHLRKRGRAPNGFSFEEARIPASPARDVEVDAAVRSALAELPAAERGLLEARYSEGRSLKELARSRGRTPKAIESALTRARAAFRECYERTRTRTARS